ncbi:MAG: NAD(P)/FAD-dependent oxidoreductase [Alcanivoracaceae bacterium]|nr:NAD(P)/FAD-dependent oxidoreductase [Alcanivoracaceae bacterium]
MSSRRLVIIGNGMAATRLLDELVARDARRFAITVIGEEAAAGYNRIMLSPWLAGEKSRNELITHPRDWYEQHGISLLSGDPAATIDAAQQCVITESGARIDWDHLIIATGSRAAMLPIPGNRLGNVLCFRTLDDAQRMQQFARRGGNAVVIGGGLLGLEAAYGLNRLGMQVSVVHNGDWLMNRQLDEEAGIKLAESLRQRGIAVHVGCNSEAFVGSGNVEGLQLADGTVLPCSLAIIGIGITPEISLARAAGLQCERAIITDALMRTSIENIFALGECCQISGELFGMIAPIYQQARVLARRLCSEETEGYQSEVLPTRLKVSGVDVFSAGDLMSLEDCRTLVWRDPKLSHYKRLWLRDGRLVAVVLFGDASDGGAYFDLIQQGKRIADPAALLFGEVAA